MVDGVYAPMVKRNRTGSGEPECMLNSAPLWSSDDNPCPSRRTDDTAEPTISSPNTIWRIVALWPFKKEVAMDVPPLTDAEFDLLQRSSAQEGRVSIDEVNADCPSAALLRSAFRTWWAAQQVDIPTAGWLGRDLSLERRRLALAVHYLNDGATVVRGKGYRWKRVLDTMTEQMVRD